MVSSGCEGGKELGFSEEASHCPCLCPLIYEPEKEISHLSLFIFFLHNFFLFLNEIKLSPPKSCTASNDRRGKIN